MQCLALDYEVTLIPTLGGWMSLLVLFNFKQQQTKIHHLAKSSIQLPTS